MKKGKYFPNDYFLTRHENFLREQGYSEEEVRRGVNKLKQELVNSRAYKERPATAKKV